MPRLSEEPKSEGYAVVCGFLLPAKWTTSARNRSSNATYRDRHLLFEVLEPLLGPDIKQISHQIHWKAPWAKYTF